MYVTNDHDCRWRERALTAEANYASEITRWDGERRRAEALEAEVERLLQIIRRLEAGIEQEENWLAGQGYVLFPMLDEAWDLARQALSASTGEPQP